MPSFSGQIISLENWKLKMLVAVSSLWTPPVRLFCAWNFPGKNTEVGCHSLLQGTFLTLVSHIADRFFTVWRRQENPQLGHNIIIQAIVSTSCVRNWECTVQQGSHELTGSSEKTWFFAISTSLGHHINITFLIIPSYVVPRLQRRKVTLFIF